MLTNTLSMESEIRRWPLRVSFQTVYYKSFQVVYFVSIAFGACVIIAAFCIDHDGIESKLTSGVAKKLQGTKGEEIVNSA